MNPAIIQAIINLALDTALIVTKEIKGGANVDDAIAALEKAKTKTAQDYLDEAGKP